MKYSNIKSKKMILAISFAALLLFLGVSIVKAFYTDTSSVSILASLVGDFDSGDGDINMLVYKENDDGDYVRTFAIPALGYTYNSSLTNCSIECSNSATNPNANCTYTINNDNTITMNSDEKVTCKFYFDKHEDTDIVLNVLKEDENGTYEYNLKHYSLTDNVPAYGYNYTNNYSCDNNSTMTYNAETRTFNIQTTQKEVCYAYFDKNNITADIIANVYVQESNGTYTKVETIPQHKRYVLSQTQTSLCVDSNSANTNATIAYTNGNINIDATGKQTCTIYLDLES